MQSVTLRQTRPLPGTAQALPSLGPCKPWTGYIRRDGYAGRRVNGRWQQVHRAAFEQANGFPIPPGFQVGHLCHDHDARNGLCAGGDSCTHRSCIEPEHLALTTPGANTLASPNTPTGRNARKTHCDRGHPLAGDNLGSVVVRGRPRRLCRECHRARERAKYARRRERAT